MFDDPLQLVFLIGWAVYLFGVYGPSTRRYRRAKIAEARTRAADAALDITAFIAWQVVPLIYIFSAWLDFANYRLPAGAGWVGAVIFVAALALLGKAYHDLGRNWSPKIEIGEEQQLVTGGVYGAIRHPIYSGILLWAIAQPLLLHNWIAGWAMLVVFIPLFLVRIPREEQMMLEQFGEAYRAYMGQTGRLIPRL